MPRKEETCPMERDVDVGYLGLTPTPHEATSSSPRWRKPAMGKPQQQITTWARLGGMSPARFARSTEIILRSKTLGQKPPSGLLLAVSVSLATLDKPIHDR